MFGTWLNLGLAARASRLSLLLSMAVVVGAAWGGTSARADAKLNDGGMDLHLYRPAIDSRGHFSVNGSDVLPHKGYSFGLILDGGFGILHYNGFATKDPARPLIAGAEADRRDRIVDHMITGTFLGNIGLFDRLSLGIRLPFVITQGPSMQVPGSAGGCFGAAPDCVYNSTQGTGLSFQSIGDIGVNLKLGLLPRSIRKFGMAAIGRVQFPTGDSTRFAGEPGISAWPSLVLQYTPNQRVKLSIEGGYRWNQDQGATFQYDGRTNPAPPGTAEENPTPVAGVGNSITYDDLATFGFGSSFGLSNSLDLVLEFYGTQLVNDIGGKGTLSMEALGGIKYYVYGNSYLMIGGGAGIPKTGFQAADWRGTVGFVFEPGAGDRDGDGYQDDRDGCPDDPEDFDGFEDSDGCSDPDNDQDGILDVDDDCPLVPEDFDGDSDQDGCPEGNTGDRDGDGIPDEKDQCPDEPEDFDGFQDTDGCPDPDNDGDGILDKDDLCPDDPEDFDGFEDEDGCPDPDNDRDRILDPDDSCPNEPETYNGFKDEDGCPDKGKVIIEGDHILILDKIYFETDKTVIMKKSYPIVEAVAATLNGNPQLTLVEIQGHADERSSDKHNINLTTGRAAAVREALAVRGVSLHRLRSAGYGERCPVDARHNEAAWEKNRRVEFKIIETEDGPTGVEVTCPAGREFMP